MTKAAQHFLGPDWEAERLTDCWRFCVAGGGGFDAAADGVCDAIAAQAHENEIHSDSMRSPERVRELSGEVSDFLFRQT